MTYNFIFEPDYSRIINSIFIDNRTSIPEIKNQTGYVIKNYIDEQLALINDNCITYKIETELGVLAGFFTIEVNTENKTAVLLMKQIRPAFKQFEQDITLQINNFIFNNEWKGDFLF